MAEGYKALTADDAYPWLTGFEMEANQRFVEQTPAPFVCHALRVANVPDRWVVLEGLNEQLRRLIQPIVAKINNCFLVSICRPHRSFRLLLYQDNDFRPSNPLRITEWQEKATELSAQVNAVGTITSFALEVFRRCIPNPCRKERRLG
jgi:hypothetical protein